MREDAAALAKGHADKGSPKKRVTNTDNVLAASQARVAATNAYLDDPRRQEGFTQSERFIDKAREHGADGDEEAFKGVLRKPAKPKPL